MSGPIWWEWLKRLLEFWRKQLEPATTSGVYASASASYIISDLSGLLTTNGIPSGATARMDLLAILYIADHALDLSWNDMDETDLANMRSLVESTRTALDNA